MNQLNKMKRYFFTVMVIVAISFTISGCASDEQNSFKQDKSSSVNEESQIVNEPKTKEELSVIDNEENQVKDVSQAVDQQEDGEGKNVSDDQAYDQELSISFDIQSVSQESYNGFLITTFVPKYPQEDYFINLVNKVGSNLLVGLKGRKENLPELSLVGYNLETGSKKEIYKGKGFGGFYSGFKLLDDGTRLLLQGRDKIYFLDKDTLELLEEIEPPEDIYEYDISFDASKLAYISEGSLYVTDLDFSETQLLVESEKFGPDSDFYGFFNKHYGLPKWSHDGTKILYVIGTYEYSEGIGIVNADGSSKQVIKRKMFEPGSAEWFFNDEKILIEQVIGEPKIYTFDLNKAEFDYIKDTSDPELSSPSPAEEKFIYEGGSPKYDDPAQLYMVEPSGEYPITPLIDNRIHGITWSPSGEEVIILADEQVIIVTPKELLSESKLTVSNKNMKYDENIDRPKPDEEKQASIESGDQEAENVDPDGENHVGETDINWEELAADYNPPSIGGLLKAIKNSEVSEEGNVTITPEIKREFNRMGENYRFFFMPKVNWYHFESMAYEATGKALSYILFMWTDQFGDFPGAPKYEAEARLRKVFAAKNEDYPKIKHQTYGKCVRFDGEKYTPWPESYNANTMVYDLTELKVSREGTYTYYTASANEYQFDLTGGFKPEENEKFLEAQAEALELDHSAALAKLLETGEISNAPDSRAYSIEFRVKDDNTVPKIVAVDK